MFEAAVKKNQARFVADLIFSSHFTFTFPGARTVGCPRGGCGKISQRSCGWERVLKKSGSVQS